LPKRNQLLKNILRARNSNEFMNNVHFLLCSPKIARARGRGGRGRRSSGRIRIVSG